jgi:hypothetical protein
MTAGSTAQHVSPCAMHSTDTRITSDAWTRANDCRLCGVPAADIRAVSISQAGLTALTAGLCSPQPVTKPASTKKALQQKPVTAYLQ